MNVRLYWADVAPLADPARFERLAATVWPVRQEKLARLHADGPRCLSLGVALLLRHALLDAGLWSEALEETEKGQPFFSDLPAFHFSLSHSGARVLCAAADGDVGCDLERPRPFSLSLAGRFFHPTESAYLAALPEDRRQDAFFRLWTGKESFMKAVGQGFALPMSDFALAPEGDRAAVSQQFDGRTYRVRYVPMDDYLCAVCAADSLDALRLIAVDFSQAQPRSGTLPPTADTGADFSR